MKLTLPAIILASLSLISCGGGDEGGAATTGYTGLRTAASVTATNKDSIAVAATAGAAQAVADSAAASALPLSASPLASFGEGFSARLQNKLTAANRTANQPVNGVCSSGIVDLTQNQDGTLVSLIFSNCVVIDGNGEIVNGTVVITTTDPQNFTDLTVQFVNFSVLYLGETYAIDATIVCGSFSCNWSSDFIGPDGRIYRAENIEVISLGGDSFSVSAIVYDPDNGFVQIDGNIVYSGCAGGVPSAGTLSFIGAGASTGSVTFNGCDEFVVTVGGVGTTYLWVDFLS
jgi:hypothetical protein